MTFIFITLGLIITYFVIAALKEGEARETIEMERKSNNRKLANVHFENVISNELKRQEILTEARKIFIQQLEKDEAIKKVTFYKNTLSIVFKHNIEILEANDYAQMWIDTLLPSTGVDIVNVYNRDGFIYGRAEREI